MGDEVVVSSLTPSSDRDVSAAAHTECRFTPAWQPGTDSNLQRAGKQPSAAQGRLPSDERIAEWVDGARKVLADELPAGHELWKSWALDLADQVLALARLRETK